MSYLIPFDDAVDKKCGRLSMKEIARTGYYRKSDMDRSYQDLYLNPSVQTRFGVGVSKMKSNPEDVFMKSAYRGAGGASIGSILPPVFGARRYNLGVSLGSMSMFSESEYGEVDMSDDSLDDETRSERMRRMGGSMRDVEEFISENNSYWDNGSTRGLPTQAELDFYEGQDERLQDERERGEHERFLDDTTYVRAEDAMIAGAPRLRNIQNQGQMDMEMRTRLWSYDQTPTTRREILTGLPPVHSSARPVALYQTPPAVRTVNELVPNEAVPPQDAINQQPRARM